MEYKIVAEAAVHEGPIRSLCIGPLGEIVSGSQDSKVHRMSISGEIQLGFDKIGAPLSHNHWVPALTSLPPGCLDFFSDGCIITGCQDSMIRIFSTTGDILNTLAGHAKGVISFSWTVNMHLISGSWDGTARIWDISTGQCLQILGGHENGVHVLGLPSGPIATTSTGEQVNDRPGNYFLRYWDAVSGKQLSRPRCDHTGSMRSITKFEPIGIATSANDGTVVIRTYEGDPIATYSHPPQDDGCAPFILDVISLEPAAHGDEPMLVSCGEDGSVMVWTVNGAMQAVPHPVCCWCALALPGGDFVTAGHDGVLRLFSRTPQKTETVAARELQSQFMLQVEECVSKRRSASSQGGVDAAEIARSPAWDARGGYSGRADGETRIFNRNGTGVAAQWSATSGSWIEIGEVVGGGGGDDGTINGTRYDHVMPVEVDTATGPQNLKLGYNTGENPFIAAQRFIDENMLSQAYLRQIADWITARVGSQGPTIDLGAAPSGPVPLVGMPGANSTRHSAAPSSFSSSMSGGSSTMSTSAPASHVTPLFPVIFPLTFEDVPSGLTGKIIPKIEALKASSGTLSGEDIRLLKELVDVLSATSRYHVSSISSQQIASVLKMLVWSDDNVFPAFDLLRMVCAHPVGDNVLGALKADSKQMLLNRILSVISAGPAAPNATAMMATRFLCNVFKSETLRKSFLETESTLENWLSAVTCQCTSSQKLVRLSAVTLIVNIIVSGQRMRNELKADLYAQSLSVLFELLTTETESADVIFKALLGLGTALVYGNKDTKSLAVELEFKKALQELKTTWKSKLNETIDNCLSEVLRLL